MELKPRPGEIQPGWAKPLIVPYGIETGLIRKMIVQHPPL